jgi:hypothetical protein
MVLGLKTEIPAQNSWGVLIALKTDKDALTILKEASKTQI